MVETPHHDCPAATPSTTNVANMTTKIPLATFHTENCVDN